MSNYILNVLVSAFIEKNILALTQSSNIQVVLRQQLSSNNTIEHACYPFADNEVINIAEEEKFYKTSS